MRSRPRAPRRRASWRRSATCCAGRPRSTGEARRPMPEFLARLFGTPEASAAFGDRARLQGMLDFEAALARAEARIGVIPAAAAESIARHCRAELFDVDRLAEATAAAGNPAIPMVAALTALVAADDAEAARYVHWGATSQDAIERHSARFEEVQSRALVLQLGGAAGTLAALGGRGMEVAQALADELGLAVPAMPWHAHRDRIAEVAAFLALLIGTLGKMARDLSLLMQTEVGEAFEPDVEGRGGSSTMPQKRNPVSAAVALAAAARAPGLVATVLSSMVQEHERGLGGWHAEWETLPELSSLAAGALRQMVETIEGLEVDPERMRANLDATKGGILAEAVAMALAARIGKAQAHQIVERASRRARETGRRLQDVLGEDPAVSTHLTARDLTALFEPRNYLGESVRFVDRVLAGHRRRREAP